MGTLAVDKLLKTSTGAAEFTLPATDGTAGQVWQTDGSGQISVAALAADTVGTAQLSATGTASATTYLRGDNAWSTVDTGTSWQAVQTASFTAVAGNGYPINTTAAQITMTLPLSPSVGDTIEFIDYAGTFDSNQLQIARNGSNIKGAAADVSTTTDRIGVRMVYVDATQGWLLTEL